MILPLALVALVLFLLAALVLVRLAVALCLAAAVATVLSLLLGGGIGTGVLLTLLLALPIHRVLRRRGRGAPRRPRAAAERSGTASPWEALARAVPRERKRLERAEASCADFLRLADASGFRPETAELQLLVGKRVPELIAHGLARAGAAAPADRRQVLDATVASVLEAAAAAEVEYDTLWRTSGDRFTAQRAHLASRLRPGPLSSV